MKIRQAMETIKSLKPSQCSDEILLEWISRLDGMVWEDILRGYCEPPCLPYRMDADMDRELLIPFPHDEIYVTWLGAKIDYINDELDRYNNAMMLYNAQLQAFADAFMRSRRHRTPEFCNY